MNTKLVGMAYAKNVLKKTQGNKKSLKLKDATIAMQMNGDIVLAVGRTIEDYLEEMAEYNLIEFNKKSNTIKVL